MGSGDTELTLQPTCAHFASYNEGTWRVIESMNGESGLAIFRRNLERLVVCGCCFVISLFLPSLGAAQTCLSTAEMDAPTRSALENTSHRYFDMASKGDVAGLRQDSIPSLANNFGGIESAVIENKPAFESAQAMPRPPFVLQAEGKANIARAEFLCGVFGANGQTRDSAVFVLPNLQPGTYAVVILDVNGKKGPYTLSLILQQIGTDWKLG